MLTPLLSETNVALLLVGRQEIYQYAFDGETVIVIVLLLPTETVVGHGEADMPVAYTGFTVTLTVAFLAESLAAVAVIVALRLLLSVQPLM